MFAYKVVEKETLGSLQQIDILNDRDKLISSMTKLYLTVHRMVAQTDK